MEERASSKEIRKVIREAVESFGLSEVSDIKAFINQRLGKTYTSGQFS